MKKRTRNKISLICAVVGTIATVIGLFLNNNKKTKKEITNSGVYVEENKGNVNVYNSPSVEKISIIPVIDNRDVHLGDNVYPERWGMNYNPLNIAIYPQDTRGLIYYDKESNNFFAGNDGQTFIGQHFVEYYSKKIEGSDFSSYKFISAYQAGEEIPSILKSYYDNSENEKYVQIDPGTILYLNKDSLGNYYERYAAIAFVTSVNFNVELSKKDIDLNSGAIETVEVFIECYHGGKRPSQNENFYFYLNGSEYIINTSPDVRRKKETCTMKIKPEDIKFDDENIVAIYILPWIEVKPKFYSNKLHKTIGTAHFRDVGIINAYLRIIAK